MSYILTTEAEQDILVILRVLHQSRDPARHL